MLLDKLGKVSFFLLKSISFSVLYHNKNIYKNFFSCSERKSNFPNLRDLLREIRCRTCFYLRHNWQAGDSLQRRHSPVQIAHNLGAGADLLNSSEKVRKRHHEIGMGLERKVSIFHYFKGGFSLGIDGHVRNKTAANIKCIKSFL